jgi:hypothetical protein
VLLHHPHGKWRLHESDKEKMVLKFIEKNLEEFRDHVDCYMDKPEDSYMDMKGNK